MFGGTLVEKRLLFHPTRRLVAVPGSAALPRWTGGIDASLRHDLVAVQPGRTLAADAVGLVCLQQKNAFAN